MSNDQTCIKQIKSKNNYGKYPSFNQYLNNIFSYISSGNFLIQKGQNDFENINQNSLLKYSKISGSKTIFLSNINSLPLKDDLNQNLDLEKAIKENLSFISANTKYINNIQKINNKTNNIFQNNLFIPQYNNNQNNIFNINRNIFSKTSNIFNQSNEIENNNNNKKENNFIIHELSESNIIKDNSPKNKFNSILNDQKLNTLINSGTQSIYRQDYYIKQFKVQYSIWLRNILNSKLSLFLKKIKYNNKYIKFYPLNSLKFTANPKYKDNKIFLSLKIKDILIIGINGNRSSNQKKNKENIEFIEKLAIKNNEINDDLIEFLNLTMEESINIFYKSEQFIKFKNSTQAKINDNKFYEEKKFSLLEENGFIFLIKNYNGNSKSEEFN